MWQPSHGEFDTKKKMFMKSTVNQADVQLAEIWDVGWRSGISAEHLYFKYRELILLAVQ
jgi:hypothetical protein